MFCMGGAILWVFALRNYRGRQCCQTFAMFAGLPRNFNEFQGSRVWQACQPARKPATQSSTGATFRAGEK